MTERIIDFLDALVATVNDVESRYCLVEKREKQVGETVTNIPYEYVGNGNFRPVEIDGGSISYFRLVNNVSFSVVDGNTAIKDLQGTYPIRYVAIIKRDEVNPLTKSQDVANILEGRNKDLQTQLKARNVQITVDSIDTDSVRIWREEFDLPYGSDDFKRSMIMIDLTVTVIAKRECWQDCDDYPDILQGFAWCEDTAATVARLTEAQRTCLEAEICTPCSDATVTNNAGTYSLSIPSGDTQALPLGKVRNKEGNDVQVDYIPASDGYIFEETPCAGAGSLEIGIYSDSGFTNPITSADIGDTIYIRAENVSGITPVEYLFLFEDADGVFHEIYRGPNDNTSWLVDASVGVGNIYALATEDASEPKSWVGNSKTLEIDSSYLLDVVPNAKYAWSVSRKLKATYTGFAFNVRRASDNAILDIGFTGEEIDTAALETFCAGTNGYITIIYAQDGDGNLNLTQTVAGSQPQIVASGSTILKNGKPAAKFSSDFLETVNLGSTVLDGNSMALSVFNQSVANNYLGGIFEEVAATSSRVVSFADTRAIINRAVIYDPVSSSATNLDMIAQAAQDSPTLRVYTRVLNDMDVYDNGTLQSSGSNATVFASATKIKLGLQTIGSFYHDNTIQELVIYDTDRSSDRSAAENNINNFYGIY